MADTWLDGNVSLIIRRLSTPEFSVNVPVLIDIYIAAMEYDPAIRDTRINVWRRNSTNLGFRAVCAFLNDRVVGIAYGFRGDQDHWWQHQLRRGLREEGGPTTDQIEILRDYFEVAEVHVMPGHQGLGIGRKMMLELLAGHSIKNAVLSTPEVDSESNYAFGLYRSLGFHDLLRHFRFEGDQREFAVLHAQLPLVQDSSADGFVTGHISENS